MNKLKSFCKYVGIFVITIAILLGLMVSELKLMSREKIEKNIEASIPTLKSRIEVKRIKIDDENTYLHVYADEILLNMIYCMNAEKPLKSVMVSNYYEEHNIPSLEKALEGKSFGNMQYMRYWHGSTIIIRPLLMFLNISQIYYLLAVLLIILLSILFVMLIKRKAYLLIVAFITGLIMTTSQYVPFCLEYAWTYIIMLVTSIIAIHLVDKIESNKKINMLMFITGIITCFLDFLSTETLTFTIPIIIVFVLRNKQEKIKDIKTELKQIILWMILWLIGYVSMWGAKWLLSAIILNANSLNYVVHNAMERIVDTDKKKTVFEMMKNSLHRNITALYPSKLFRSSIINTSIIIAIITAIVLLKKQDKKEIQKALIILGIGIIPYIRYITIIQHSTSHFFFTFRAQVATIIAVIMSTSIIIDKNKFTKNIVILKKEKEKDGKKHRINNINTCIR